MSFPVLEMLLTAFSQATGIVQSVLTGNIVRMP